MSTPVGDVFAIKVQHSAFLTNVPWEFTVELCGGTLPKSPAVSLEVFGLDSVLI